MARPDGGDAPAPSAERRAAAPSAGGPHYGRYAGLLALLVLVLITINTIATKPNGDTGIAPGVKVAPFAVPLALGNLEGDADVATGPGQGLAGRVPACQERSAAILNICQLYERGPVVLALFVEGGSCPAVLSQMQALTGSFSRVTFAAVAIKGERKAVRAIVRARGLTFPVGLDRDGALAALYKVASCPQVTFIERGGVVQSRALLGRPAPATLRARVAALAGAAGAGG
jgi:AhpC/TSA family